MYRELTMPLTPGLTIGPPAGPQLKLGDPAELLGNGSFHEHLLAELDPGNRADIPSERLMGAVLPEQEAELRARLPKAQQAEIKEAALGIESWLFYTLFKEMWATIPEDGLLNTGMAGQFYREMYLEEISDSAARQDNGVNIDEIIELQLLRHEAAAVDRTETVAERDAVPQQSQGFVL